MIDGTAKYLLIVSIFILACIISYIRIVVRNFVEDKREERNFSRLSRRLEENKRLAENKRLEENQPMLEIGK
jgi:hypothetical protein